MLLNLMDLQETSFCRYRWQRDALPLSYARNKNEYNIGNN